MCVCVCGCVDARLESGVTGLGDTCTTFLFSHYLLNFASKILSTVIMVFGESQGVDSKK